MNGKPIAYFLLGDMRILFVIFVICSFSTSLAKDPIVEHRRIAFHYTDDQVQGTAPLLSITKKLSGDGPVLTFKIFRLDSVVNRYYRMDVCSEDGSRTIQQIVRFATESP